MIQLIVMLIALALLAGFVLLVEYEERRGTRLFAARRSKLDATVTHLGFIYEHVNLSAFIRDEARRLAQEVSHAVAHQTLQLVRAVERLLTRLVRHLRTNRTGEYAPRENAREFVKTLSAFKGQLRDTPPQMSELQ